MSDLWLVQDCKKRDVATVPTILFAGESAGFLGKAPQVLSEE
jgi:hypothetical protein